MRAAKGIFRTVDKPFGQVDARPSKSYRISWIGVCFFGRSQNDTHLNPDPLTPLDEKRLVWFPTLVVAQRTTLGLTIDIPHLPVNLELFRHENG
jgi:hypothetical protein